MIRQKLRRYLSENPGYGDFLIWLDRKFKHPRLRYRGLSLTVEAILDEPLGLLTEGEKK